MNPPEIISADSLKEEDLHCELLILSDGTVLAHNLTPVMAGVLQVLNPTDETLRQRASQSALPAVVEPPSAP